MDAFRLDGAGVAYDGRPVLRDIRLRIAAGEKVSLIGPSGAGKSTLLSLLYGRRPRDVALVPQDPALVRTLSVFHNTYMGRLDQNPTWYNLLNLAWPQRREVERVTCLLERLGIADKRFSPAGTLSGGQQQRTAVARALYRESRILLGDEPVSAIDPSQAADVLARIAEGHETVVLAMHDIALALRFTDRVVGVADGRIVFDEPSGGLSAEQLLPFFREWA